MFYCFILCLAWLVWHIAFRIEVVGRKYLPKSGAYVLAPNHVSAIDPVFVAVARFWGKRMQIMAKAELFEIHPLLSWFFVHVGAVRVARGKGDLQMLEQVIEGCKQGHGLLIFAEGTRSKDTWPGRIKSGAFVVASAAQVPIIPCRIIYCNAERRARIFCRAKVCFGPPIAPAAPGPNGKPSNVELRQAKRQLSQSWRQLYLDNKLDWMPEPPEDPRPAPLREEKEADL